jgi:hypothetical protein
MFSANENLLLRQHKRRVVGYVEATMTESVLDYGVNVMVMQVQCTAPGCVPIETCIIIVFPASKTELIPGLPESAGGSFKTKVLKPMAEIEQDDVLDVLPPVFIGGKKPTLEQLSIRVRDVMLGQITQVFGDLDVDGRTLVARYLQTSLNDYIDNECEPPEWGAAAFPKTTAAAGATTDSDASAAVATEEAAVAAASASVETSNNGGINNHDPTVDDAPSSLDVTGNTTTMTSDVWKNGKGNVTLPRPVDDAISDTSLVQPQKPGTKPRSTSTYRYANTSTSLLLSFFAHRCQLSSRTNLLIRVSQQELQQCKHSYQP